MVGWLAGVGTGGCLARARGLAEWRRVVVLGWLAAAVGRLAAATLDPAALSGVDIGNPGVPGAVTADAGSIEISAGGAAGIGLASDQFHFLQAADTNDFDLQVRVVALRATDLWAKAGLMVRDSLAANSRFVGVFATPSGAGCALQARNGAGAASVYLGAFPANQPFTWLRLQRAGNVYTGYAGYDGLRWTLLGTRTVLLGSTATVGLAVTSHSTNATIAVFRDAGDTVSTLEEQVPSHLEPPGPCSRRTALVFSEIMYNPAPRVDGRNLEYVELYNSNPYFEDLSGWRLAGDIQYVFPEGTVVPGGGYLVVAAAPSDLAMAYGLEGSLGPYDGRLGNGGGTLQLRGDRDAVLLEVAFNDRAPWPETADGFGHSLVMARPSRGESDPLAWGASRIKGGSPGAPEVMEPSAQAGLRFNEWTMPDAQGHGFVEVFNAGSRTADLGGLRLGLTPTSMTFAVQPGRILEPGGFAQFSWVELGFRPSALGGDVVLLESADGSRILDLARCRPQVPGTSTGRWPNGWDVVRALPQPTPGVSNERPRSDVVISEIHHSPLSGDNAEEFIELHNTGVVDIDLAGWAFTSGVSFQFAAGERLPAGGYRVVVHDVARFRQLHPEVPAGLVSGGVSGNLSGRGERLVLSRPVVVTNGSGLNEQVLAVATEASYLEGTLASRWADGGGSTLELQDLRGDAMLPGGWVDSDETGKGEWTTVEATGLLDHGPAGGGFPGPGGGGVVMPDSLHITLMGEGECLIDNVEVVGPGGTNRVANGTFEAGTTGWTFSGNHSRSSLEVGEGDQSSQSLHLRASNNGDTGANKVFVKLTQALPTNVTATLRARVKWLRGWPEILLRLHGNYHEACGRMNLPGAVGTPGARNSRAVDNAGPVVSDLAHFPVIPGTNEPVRVTARVDDPDGVVSVVLRYRVDPGTTMTEVPLRDDGTGGDLVPGDGLYSGMIPAPGAVRLVAFTVTAQDGAAAISVHPPGAPARECLVLFGDGVSSGAFGTYRLWVTQANSDAWKNRPVLSNEPVDSTFVYGGVRAIQGSGGRFAGSPFHQNFTAGPASEAHFVVEFPKGERVLGAAALNKLHAPGNGAFDDALLQREQAVYWLARKSGLVSLHRRFFHFYVNGVKKRTLMEDTQVGSDDLVEEYWPGDSAGTLYKMQPWFEFPDAVSQSLQMSSSSFVSLNRFTTTGGELKLARYRWNWLVRGAEGTANDFTNVFGLINTVTDYAATNYADRVDALVDVDQWLRFFALNHAVGNWDSVGYRNQQNTYAYKPVFGPWELIIWDANIVLGNSMGDGPTGLPLFTTGDPTLSRWLASGSAFRRRYLVALNDLVNGPMQASALAPMLDAKYAAFREHGVIANSPEPVKTWVTSARSYILGVINQESGPFAVTSVEGTTSLALEGTGPLDMSWLEVNGVLVPVTWDTTRNWHAAVASDEPPDTIVVVAVDARGQPLAGSQQTIALHAERRLSVSVGEAGLVFQYPVLRRGGYQLQWTETLAMPDWRTVTNASAVLGTLQLQLPAPGAPAFYRVLEP